MSYIYYNPNPKHKSTTDCVVRMICKMFGLNWREAFLDLCNITLSEYEMPSSIYTWERYLVSNGFKKCLLPSECPDCMSVSEFTNMYNFGEYVLFTGTHVIAVIDGDYYDAWDSGNEIVTCFFERR